MWRCQALTFKGLGNRAPNIASTSFGSQCTKSASCECFCEQHGRLDKMYKDYGEEGWFLGTIKNPRGRHGGGMIYLPEKRGTKGKPGKVYVRCWVDDEDPEDALERVPEVERRIKETDAAIMIQAHIRGHLARMRENEGRVVVWRGRSRIL